MPEATALDSERFLTEEGGEALKLVEKAIQIAALKRRKVDLPISLCILPSENQPTGALWQRAPLLWIHPKISPAKVLSYYLSCLGCPIGIAGFTAMHAAFWHPS